MRDHAPGKLRGLVQVVFGAGAVLIEDQLFGRAAAEQEKQPGAQLAFGDVDAVLLRQQLRGAEERAAARDDRDLVQAVYARHEPCQQGVARLVVGRHRLFLFGKHVLAFCPHKQLVAGIVEVGHIDVVFIVPARPKCGLVDQIANVGPGQTDGCGGNCSRSTSISSGTSRLCTSKMASRPL